MSWNWRGLSIGAQLALPLVLVGGPLLMQLTMPISPATREQPIFTMFQIAGALDEADRRGVPIPRADREAMERVLASRYRMVGSTRQMPDQEDGRRRRPRRGRGAAIPDGRRRRDRSRASGGEEIDRDPAEPAPALRCCSRRCSSTTPW